MKGGGRGRAREVGVDGVVQVEGGESALLRLEMQLLCTGQSM